MVSLAVLTGVGADLVQFHENEKRKSSIGTALM